MARPFLLPPSKNMATGQETRGPILKIKGLWHPYALGENGGLPVPNDVILGKDTDGYHARTMLLTGPNMGGKSTLLRATCLAVILAQVLFRSLSLHDLFCYLLRRILVRVNDLISSIHFKLQSCCSQLIKLL